MANKRISELTTITGANLADADLLVVVDVSDTTMASSGTNKKITMAELAKDSALTDNLIAKTTLTTDGDVLTRAAGAPARITRADLAQDSAFSSRYAPIATIGRVAGRYYRPAVGANSALAFALANGTEFAVPFFVSADDTFDRIAINVTVAGAAGSVIRLGIKKESGGAPGDLVLDAGTVDSTGTGAKTITISQSLTAGWYWLVAVGQGSPATNPEVTNCIAPSNQIIGHPTDSISFSTTFAALSQTGITGALANGGTFSGIQERAPLVMVRAS